VNTDLKSESELITFYRLKMNEISEELLT